MKIDKLREAIDKIDERIVKLLNKRAGLAIMVGEIKTKNGKLIRAPRRERQIYKRLREINEGPFSHSAFKNIYREVISASLSLERKLKDKTGKRL